MNSFNRHSIDCRQKKQTMKIADAPGTGYHYLKLPKGSGTYLFEAEFDNGSQ